MQTTFTEQLNSQLISMLMEQLLYMNSWPIQQTVCQTKKEESILQNEKFVVNHYRLFKLYTDKLKKENDDQKEQMKEFLNAIHELNKDLNFCKQKIKQQRIEIEQKNISLHQLQRIEDLVFRHHAFQKKFTNIEPVKLHTNFIKEHSNEQLDQSSMIINSPCFGKPMQQKTIRPFDTTMKPSGLTKKIFKSRCSQSRVLRNIRGVILNLLKGSWTSREQNRFLYFIDKFKQIFISPYKIAKHLSIFSKMAKFVGTRTVAQCQKHQIEHSMNMNSTDKKM